MFKRYTVIVKKEITCKGGLYSWRVSRTWKLHSSVMLRQHLSRRFLNIHIQRSDSGTHPGATWRKYVPKLSLQLLSRVIRQPQPQTDRVRNPCRWVESIAESIQEDRPGHHWEQRGPSSVALQQGLTQAPDISAFEFQKEPLMSLIYCSKEDRYEECLQKVKS